MHKIIGARMRAAAARLVRQRRCRPLLNSNNAAASSSLGSRCASTTSSQQTPAALAAAAAPRAIWLPLPRLAPYMAAGRVHAWLKAERDPVACYEVIAEVATDSLVEPENRVGKFAGEVALLLEAQEDGFVARVLQPAGGAPGAVVKVGAPVAVLCEEEEEIDATVQGLDSLPPHVLPSLDLYDPEAQRLLRICNWQAYLRDPPPEGDEAGCGCS